MADPTGALRIGPTHLAAGRTDGPLRGRTMVVKDLFDLAGTATGAGNPDWLGDAPVAATTAPAVQRLLDAGVDVIGKAYTDELAFSLSGTNVHYGTPVNPAAPGRIPGGSSSGSASAVASGLCDIGVGTDTGGSIRVPASYCGLFGWRPTHGRVSLDGCVALAPSFDTVGLLTSDGIVLRDAAAALLDSSTPVARATELMVAEDLLTLADGDVRAQMEPTIAEIAAVLAVPVHRAPFAMGRATEWFAAFRAWQMYEAWQTHGAWITERSPSFGPGIGARFAMASAASADAALAARDARDAVRAALVTALGSGGALVVPAAATIAPPADLGEPQKTDLRTRTMTLTCVAGLAGAPAVVIPPVAGSGPPAGTCLVGRPGDDEMLLAVAAAVQAARAAGAS